MKKFLLPILCFLLLILAACNNLTGSNIKLSEDTDFSLIYLDDDDIPELVICPEPEVYSIYTVKDEELFCLVDSIRARRGLDYYERSSMICKFGISNGGGDTGGYGWDYYQISTDCTITDDSKAILTWSYEAIYDADNNYTGEGQVSYYYLGKETDQTAYEDICRDLGVENIALGHSDVGRENVCEGYGIKKEMAVQLLSCTYSSPGVSESFENLQTLYWELYKKKLEETTENIELYFIYLDDDDIPELAVCTEVSPFYSYSIYTVKDGKLFCLVESIQTEALCYLERQNIICAFTGWEEGCIEKKDSYYKILPGQTLMNDSQPMLERSNDILYDENGDRIYEDTPSRYRYMGQDTDEITFDKICAESGITDDVKDMCWGNALEKEIALELLNP